MFHKAFGVLSLVSFAYRFALLICTGNSGLREGDPWTLAFVVLHTILTFSALIFHVPVQRVKSQPMIYKESQLHSIVFSMRSIAVIACRYLGPDFAPFRGLFIIMAHWGADLATQKYKQGTLMRDMPYPSEWTTDQRKAVQLFYSYAQILAIVGVFLVDFDGPFLVLFPVQIGALLMTLVRKNIITAKGWHVIYAWSLFLPFIYTFTCMEVPDMAQLIVIGTIAAVLRFRFHVNKYCLWVPLCAYTIFECDIRGSSCFSSLLSGSTGRADLWAKDIATSVPRYGDVGGNMTGEQGSPLDVAHFLNFM